MPSYLNPVNHLIRTLRPAHLVCALVTAALVLRLWLAIQAPTPGLFDPTHYFNLARNLVAGRGFVVDHIWQFHTPPADVTHPDDYYPPLTAIMAAASMWVFGVSVWAALVPSVMVGGVLLPLVTLYGARVAGLPIGGRLFALALVAFTPEFVLNSVRTDTTIFFVTFATLALIGMYQALIHPHTWRGVWWAVASGGAAGLTYLTRLDGLLLLPTFAVTLLAFLLLRPARVEGRWAITRAVPIFIGVWLLVVAPWLIRNQVVLGKAFPVRSNMLMFVTSFIDLFAYEKELTLETYLAQGIGNVVGKIAFEGAGNLKMMIVLLGVMSPLVAVGIAMLAGRGAQLRRVLLPAGVYLLGTYVSYTVLTPYLSQGGSFKKAVMTLLPYAMISAAWAVGEIAAEPGTRTGARTGLMAACGLIMAFYSLDLVRADFREAATYDAAYREVVAAARGAGDTNGDGRIILFATEPFQAAYLGLPTVMYPSDPRPVVFRVADRYQIDYFVLPAGRPALDGIVLNGEEDPRLRFVWKQAGPQGMVLYRYVPQVP